MRLVLVLVFAVLAISLVSAIPTSYSKNQLLNSIFKQIQNKKDNIGEDWYGIHPNPAVVLIRNPYNIY